MAIEITGTGKGIPPRRVTNQDLAARLDTSDEWIRSHTGIGARHLCGEETAAGDLALEAAQKALAMIDDDWQAAARTLDMIVLATVTPDYIGSPSTA